MMRIEVIMDLPEGFGVIPIYEHAYAVNREGIVLRLPQLRHYRNRVSRFSPGAEIKQYVSSKGYKRFSLVSSSGKKSFLTHRAVALCFIPNPENKEQINHINHIKTDNSASNLEWCTNYENALAATVAGRRKSGPRSQKTIDNLRRALVLNLLNGVFHYSITEASECYGIAESTFQNVKNGIISKRCRNFIVFQNEIGILKDIHHSLSPDKTILIIEK